MARLYNTIRVTAAPDRAWAIVGDLAGVIKWIPGVTGCRVEGTRRICNDGQIQEEISDYSAGRRSYRLHACAGAAAREALPWHVHG
jgi:hypothetical protein